MSAAIAAAAIGGAAVIGGAVIASNGAQSAASTQANAADSAAQTQWNEFEAVQGNEQPYMSLGQGAITPLLQAMGYNVSGTSQPSTAPAGTASWTPDPSNPNNIIVYNSAGQSLGSVPAGNANTSGTTTFPSITSQGDPTGSYNLSVNPNSILQQTFKAPTGQYTDKNGNFNFAPTQAQLQQTPGYQFQLSQGEQAINNSAAASGGLLSGATLKDLLSYSQGLADTTYQNQFSDALNTYQTNYSDALSSFNTNYNSAANNVNRLSGLVTLGQNAATTTGNQGLQTAANAGQLTTSAANATAAGTVASSNATAGALSSLGSTASNYGLLSQLTGQGTSSYGAGTAWTPSTGVSSGEAAALGQ